jgi:hypothetical protein
MKNNATKCSVPDCNEKAACEVILYDVYPYNGEVFFEQDHTCPYICKKHIMENEDKADGERAPRGSVHYPFTNKNGAQGMSIYRPL